jgi:PAS domain S-box-containing protein
MSIRLKLVIIFLVIALIPAFFVSVITFTNYRHSLEHFRLMQLQDIVSYKADKIETYFSTLKANVEISQHFYNIKTNLPVLNRLAHNTSDPEFLKAKSMLDDQLQEIQTVLGLMDIMLISPKGEVVYSSNPVHYSRDFLGSVTGLVQKAFHGDKNKVYFSEIYINKNDSSRFEMLVMAPVTDLNGSFTGIIAFEVDMSDLYKLVQEATGLGQTGETLIGKKIGNEVVYLTSLRHDPQAALTKKITLGSDVGLPIQEAAQGMTGAASSVDYRGREVIAAWRYIPLLDWGVVGKIDTQEAFAEVRNLQKLVWLILCIVFVLAVIVSFAFARSISEPIKKLTDGAEIIGRGNLDHKVGTDFQDEIGQLSRSFDKMTHDLKNITASRDELNKEIIEREKAEEALKIANERLVLAQRSAGAGIWNWDLTTGKLDWSPELFRLFGLDAAGTEVTFDLWKKTLHPEDLHIAQEKIIQAIRDHTTLQSEYRIVLPKGKVRWINALGNALYDEHGKAVRMSGICLDITKRKRLELMVKKKSKEQQVIFDSVPAMVFYKNTENRFIRTNKMFEDLMGLPKKELEGRSLFDIYPWALAEASWKDDKEVIESGKAKMGIIEPLETPKGRRWVQTDKIPFWDTQGAVKGVIGFSVDITERKRADEELRKLNRTLNALRDSDLAIIRSADENDYLNDVCRIIVEDCGYPMVWIGFADSSENKSVRPVAQAGFDKGYIDSLDIVWSDTERGRGPTGTAIRTGKACLCNNILTNPDFEPWRREAIKRGYASSLSLPLISENNVFGALNIYSPSLEGFSQDEAQLLAELAGDLSYGILSIRLRAERDKAQEILRRDKETLERLAMERSQELIRARIELERAKRLSDIGTLASTVAHELRNPLAAIGMAASNIKRKAKDQALDSHISNIEKKVKESDQIISNLLFYSRIRPPHHEKVRISSVLDECGDITEKFPRKQISLVKTLDALKNIDIEADPIQIKEVFYNILDNACDAVDDVSGRIEISGEDKGSHIKISVTDNGIGIDSEHLARIFEPFFTTKAKGTGLGLSVCQQIINFHNGLIEAQSTLEKGTSIIVTLPKKKKAPAAEEPAQAGADEAS